MQDLPWLKKMTQVQTLNLCFLVVWQEFEVLPANWSAQNMNDSSSSLSSEPKREKAYDSIINVFITECSLCLYMVTRPAVVKNTRTVEHNETTVSKTGLWPLMKKSMMGTKQKEAQSCSLNSRRSTLCWVHAHAQTSTFYATRQKVRAFLSLESTAHAN